MINENQLIWESYIDSSDTAPQFLYHATYLPLLRNIKKYGLGGNPNPRKNWEDSQNVVYLAYDPNVAESYAETSDIVDEDWLDSIIIFKINITDIDKNLLKQDSNVIDGEDTVEYHGVIPFNKLQRLTF
jgi:hypothetical protein